MKKITLALFTILTSCAFTPSHARDLYFNTWITSPTKRIEVSNVSYGITYEFPNKDYGFSVSTNMFLPIKMKVNGVEYDKSTTAIFGVKKMQYNNQDFFAIAGFGQGIIRNERANLLVRTIELGVVKPVYKNVSFLVNASIPINQNTNKPSFNMGIGLWL